MNRAKAFCKDEGTQRLYATFQTNGETLPLEMAIGAEVDQRRDHILRSNKRPGVSISVYEDGSYHRQNLGQTHFTPFLTAMDRYLASELPELSQSLGLRYCRRTYRF